MDELDITMVRVRHFYLAGSLTLSITITICNLNILFFYISIIEGELDTMVRLLPCDLELTISNH